MYYGKSLHIISKIKNTFDKIEMTCNIINYETGIAKDCNYEIKN